MRPALPYGDALRDRLGPVRGARKLASSPRSRVWRVELVAHGGRPAVVKQAVGDDDPEGRYRREGAALRAAAASGVVPELLATDPERRVLVLEHLEHRSPAPDWIVGYAESLARLHASPVDPALLPRLRGPGPQDAEAFAALGGRLGVPAGADVRAELAALVERLAEAPGSALLHGDPCPGNDLNTPGGVRFVDFEQAAVGSGATELAYLRIGFPTCWCVTAPAPALVARAEAAYRRIAPVEGDLTDACAGWLIRGDALVPRARRTGGGEHLERLPARDWTWGTAGARQRLAHRLGVVADLAGGAPDLRALGGYCTALRAAVVARWPRTTRPVPAHRPAG
ncbi:phosphotransferase family protein [Streptomyces sp. NRRL S-87]|uniref:phosphotransferase family protein n=1 Tax=Streptomyces sp. NRRL S-87 TaxID=1463920 RepID=UPI0004C0FB5D|nr:phosphotransferase [Streptomyces sp. NRRL S-87]